VTSVISRRRFLIATGTAGAAATADACGLESRVVRLSRPVMPVPSLPPALEGITIAHVTDLHLPGNRRAARHALELLEREQPDVVAFTGDLVEEAAALPLLTEFVAGISHGAVMVAIHGNWERKARIPVGALRRAYGRGGAEFLLNGRSVLARGTARLGLVGLDDGLYYQPVLNATIRDTASTDADVWLVHCPAYRDRIPADLTRSPAAVLAGHTHGGQIRLPGWTPYRPVGSGDYVSGWYREGGAPLYVSRGVGTVMVEARFFCPAELPIFTLRRA
jgi:hypothetical protein